MAKTRIDWADETVNFATGCHGPRGHRCRYCYAERMAHRFSFIEGSVYRRVGLRAPMIAGGPCGGTAGDNFHPAFHWDVYQRELDRLRRARRPRRVFVGSMGDMCFEGDALCFARDGNDSGGRMPTLGVQVATAEFAGRVEEAGHTVLLLTKRPDLLNNIVGWPANAHLGVSVAGNNDAGRITELQVALRNVLRPVWPTVLWASVEPLLGDLDPEALLGLDWVVVGLDSRVRPWRFAETLPRDLWRNRLRRIRDWCQDHGMPLFCKGSVRAAFQDEDWPQEYPTIARTK